MLRDPPIETNEWLAFASACKELQVPNEVFGQAPDGKALKLSADGFSWWIGRHSGMPVPVVLSNGAVHVGAGDASARDFAERLAAQFGAYVQEG